MAWVIRSEDRRLFKGCRRAWDFGARSRQNLAPRAEDRPAAFADALREALAVYYFPGMWSWERRIVQPLALAAFRRGLGESHAAIPRGESVLARYFDWARPLDRFTPIRVGADFEVNVPDPDRTADDAIPIEYDLVTPDGEPVRFRDAIDLLIEDENGAFWLVEHRVTDGEAAPQTELLLDEASAARCWAWERFFLGMVIRGTIFNEIVLGEDARVPFRRTVVVRERPELALHRAQFAREVEDMLDPDVRLYPSPEPGRCAACAFLRPCVAMTGGADPRPFLAAEFRVREESATGTRIGRESWPTNRALATGRLARGGPIQ